MSIAGGVGSLVVLWYGGRLVVDGRLTIGDLVAFIGYLHVLAWPTAAMGWMLTILQRGRAAMKRLNEVLAVAPAITSPAGAVEPAGARGELALRGVTFRYPGRTAPAIDDVTFTIPAGRTVAIVGRTGAGKTSIVQLLPRLFDVDAGGVLLDGHDVRALPLGWLRRTVGIVPQDPFLFSRSIRENVGFGLHDRHERVEWAVRAAGLSARSPTCRRASTRSSASAASRSPAGRSSASRWRASSPPRRACSSWTTRSPRSMPRRSGRSWTACAASSASGRP
jgi:ATP-binding cassette subfamily B protein